MSTKKNPTPETRVLPPVQLSIWDILEHPKFEKNLTKEMELLGYTGKNYAELKRKVEEQYQKDMETLELAKDNQMKELLKSYKSPADLAEKYVEVITKKSRLSRHKRELIEQLFGPIIKGTAIDIIHEREQENKKCAESSSRKDLT